MSGDRGIDPAVPTCQECGCQTGGGSYCYEHAPYTVWPKADGSRYVDRNGQRTHEWDAGWQCPKCGYETETLDQHAADLATLRSERDEAVARFAQWEGTDVPSLNIALGNVRQQLSAAEADLATLRAQVAWQPIETYHGGGTCELVRTADRRPAGQAFFGRRGIDPEGLDDDLWCDDTGDCFTVTHWMPLPPPPETESPA